MHLCICEMSFGACEALWRGLNSNLFYKTVCAVFSRLVMSDSCDPMDCSLPGSSVHGILQAKILEWVAVSFSRGSSPPTNRTWVSCIVGRLFIDRAMREAHFIKLENNINPPSFNPSTVQEKNHIYLEDCYEN